MSDVEIHRVDASPPLALPMCRHDNRIRVGVESDFAFIDALQKGNSRALGFMSEKAIRGHLSKGNVLVAEIGAEPSCTANSSFWPSAVAPINTRMPPAGAILFEPDVEVDVASESVQR